MTYYVLGFAFKKDSVYLIKKNKPDWQKGKYNGIGGKVEENEIPQYSMVREFLEETGVETNSEDWTYFGSMYEGNNWRVHNFFVELKEDQEPKTTTDEEVTKFLISDVLYGNVNLVSNNVIWLILMIKSGLLETVHMEYKK